MRPKYLLHTKTLSRISRRMTNIAVAEMTDAELDELSSRIAYTRSTRSRDKYSLAELELWRTLQEMFHRSQPIDNFVRGMDGSAGFGVQRFNACAQVLESLVNRACKSTKRPDKSQRIAMRRLLLECLRDYLKYGNIAVSPARLLNNIEKLEYAVDQQYPGYIEAGMLSYVITALPQSSE